MFNEQTTRRQRAEARRVQLIDTALAVFAQKGVDGTTVKDLSEAAGVAQGLLYHYFKSKEDLLRAALDRHYFLPQLRLISSSGDDRPVAEVLLEVVEEFANVLNAHRALVQVMLREAPSNAAVAERLEQARGEGVHVLAQYLDSRVAAGELRPHDTDTVARLLLYAVAMAHLSGAPMGRFLPAAVDSVLVGIYARPS